MIDNEEEENEVELHVEENSDGDGNVQKVDGKRDLGVLDRGRRVGDGGTCGW